MTRESPTVQQTTNESSKVSHPVAESTGAPTNNTLTPEVKDNEVGSTASGNSSESRETRITRSKAATPPQPQTDSLAPGPAASSTTAEDESRRSGKV